MGATLDRAIASGEESLVEVRDLRTHYPVLTGMFRRKTGSV